MSHEHDYEGKPEHSGAPPDETTPRDGREDKRDDGPEDKAEKVSAGAVAWDGETPVFVAAVNDDGSCVVGRFVSYEVHRGGLTTERPDNGD